MAHSIQPWIEAAGDDLEAARDLYQSGRWSYVCFLCHQTLEKLLKALVMKSSSNPAPPSHNLGYLMSQSGTTFPPEIETAILRVSPHYMNSRYPDSAGGRPSLNYNETIAKEILEMTGKAHLWLEQHLI
ncbi:MAG: HEPN domain-containing protein [Candidatus Xenobiia bacterium LiM19]